MKNFGWFWSCLETPCPSLEFVPKIAKIFKNGTLQGVTLLEINMGSRCYLINPVSIGFEGDLVHTLDSLFPIAWCGLSIAHREGEIEAIAYLWLGDEVVYWSVVTMIEG